MANLDDDYGKNAVGNLVNDTIGALPHAIPILAGQLLTTGWPRLDAQGADATNNTLSDRLLRYGFEFFEGRALYLDAIVCHGS